MNINSINAGYNNSFNGTATIACKTKDEASKFFVKCVGLANNIENNNIKILSCGSVSDNKFMFKCAKEFNQSLFNIVDKFAKSNDFHVDFKA